jgi:hypothetical protein
VYAQHLIVSAYSNCLQMGGKEAAAQIRKQDSRIPIVFLTGIYTALHLSLQHTGIMENLALCKRDYSFAFCLGPSLPQFCACLTRDNLWIVLLQPVSMPIDKRHLPCCCVRRDSVHHAGRQLGVCSRSSAAEAMQQRETHRGQHHQMCVHSLIICVTVRAVAEPSASSAS